VKARVAELNLAQRIIIVIGDAGVLAWFGEWVSTLHGYSYRIPMGMYNFGFGGRLHRHHHHYVL
jgi:hypothetical protein